MNSRFEIKYTRCLLLVACLFLGCIRNAVDLTGNSHLDIEPGKGEVSLCGGNAGTGSGSLKNGFQPTVIYKSKKVKTPPGMVFVPGGEFSMGDSSSTHRVSTSAFFMDASEVTNREFAEFVKATGYITVAERMPSREDLPGVQEEKLVAGSLVFSPPMRVVSLHDFASWWNYLEGANWKHPLGGSSSISGKAEYPVVHVAWEDAAAYAKWAGKRLPTEAEWEFAARGGKSGSLYVWGNELKPDGKWMANIFEGSFPNYDSGMDGFKGLAPVKQFPSNEFGLYDMSGNVWEWCADWYSRDYYQMLKKQGTVLNPKGPEISNDPNEPLAKKKVQRGGSFLCTDQYCSGYTVGSRGRGEYMSSSNHVGFRCVKDY